MIKHSCSPANHFFYLSYSGHDVALRVCMRVRVCARLHNISRRHLAVRSHTQICVGCLRSFLEDLFKKNKSLLQNAEAPLWILRWLALC